MHVAVRFSWLLVLLYASPLTSGNPGGEWSDEVHVLDDGDIEPTIPHQPSVKELDPLEDELDTRTLTHSNPTTKAKEEEHQTLPSFGHTAWTLFEDERVSRLIPAASRSALLSNAGGEASRLNAAKSSNSQRQEDILNHRDHQRDSGSSSEPDVEAGFECVETGLPHVDPSTMLELMSAIQQLREQEGAPPLICADIFSRRKASSDEQMSKSNDQSLVGLEPESATTSSSACAPTPLNATVALKGWPAPVALRAVSLLSDFFSTEYAQCSTKSMTVVGVQKICRGRLGYSAAANNEAAEVTILEAAKSTDGAFAIVKQEYDNSVRLWHHRSKFQRVVDRQHQHATPPATTTPSSAARTFDRRVLTDIENGTELENDGATTEGDPASSAILDGLEKRVLNEWDLEYRRVAAVPIGNVFDVTLHVVRSGAPMTVALRFFEQEHPLDFTALAKNAMQKKRQKSGKQMQQHKNLEEASAFEVDETILKTDHLLDFSTQRLTWDMMHLVDLSRFRIRHTIITGDPNLSADVDRKKDIEDLKTSLLGDIVRRRAEKCPIRPRGFSAHLEELKDAMARKRAMTQTNDGVRNHKGEVVPQRRQEVSLLAVQQLSPLAARHPLLLDTEFQVDFDGVEEGHNGLRSKTERNSRSVSLQTEALLGSMTGRKAPVTPTAPRRRNQIRIVSHNIWNYNGRWDFRLRGLTRAWRRAKPDVLLLQEVRIDMGHRRPNADRARARKRREVDTAHRDLEVAGWYSWRYFSQSQAEHVWRRMRQLGAPMWGSFHPAMVYVHDDQGMKWEAEGPMVAHRFRSLAHGSHAPHHSGIPQFQVSNMKDEFSRSSNADRGVAEVAPFKTYSLSQKQQDTTLVAASSVQNGDMLSLTPIPHSSKSADVASTITARRQLSRSRNGDGRGLKREMSSTTSMPSTSSSFKSSQSVGSPIPLRRRQPAFMREAGDDHERLLLCDSLLVPLSFNESEILTAARKLNVTKKAKPHMPRDSDFSESGVSDAAVDQSTPLFLHVPSMIRVDVCTVHFSLTPEAQMKNVKDALSSIRSLADRPMEGLQASHTILTGDLNAEPKSVAIQTLLKEDPEMEFVTRKSSSATPPNGDASNGAQRRSEHNGQPGEEDDAVSGGFTDAFSFSKEWKNAPTFCNLPSMWYTRKRIDFILYRAWPWSAHQIPTVAVTQTKREDSVPSGRETSSSQSSASMINQAKAQDTVRADDALAASGEDSSVSSPSLSHTESSSDEKREHRRVDVQLRTCVRVDDVQHIAGLSAKEARAARSNDAALSDHVGLLADLRLDLC